MVFRGPYLKRYCKECGNVTQIHRPMKSFKIEKFTTNMYAASFIMLVGLVLVKCLIIK